MFTRIANLQFIPSITRAPWNTLFKVTAQPTCTLYYIFFPPKKTLFMTETATFGMYICVYHKTIAIYSTAVKHWAYLITKMNKKEATMAIPMALLKSKQKVVNNKRKLFLLRHAAMYLTSSWVTKGLEKFHNGQVVKHVNHSVHKSVKWLSRRPLQVYSDKLLKDNATI